MPVSGRNRVHFNYHAHGRQWTLSIRDTGIGMSQAPEAPKLGLGMSLIEALSKQLNGRIQIASTHPGTEVKISHPHVTVVDGIDAAPESWAVVIS